MHEANLHWRYVDQDLVMPWYTMPALKWLKEQDISNWRVFEYGAGYSTIWWRTHALEVNSVDKDPTWAKAMGAYCAPGKQEYIFCSALSGTHYDCIIVDGAWRDECVEYCLPLIRPGGYLIIDNYEQPSVGDDFTKTNKLLEGWEKQVFKQPNHTDWQTAIFTKP
jgi:hypothetical protein